MRIPKQLLRLSRFVAVVAGLLMPQAVAHAQEQTVFVYGDSLMAGYGLPPEAGFVAQLQSAIEAEGIANVRLENVSVSGDTSASGLARLDWALGTTPDAVLLGLGANDMLQGLDPTGTRANLEAIMKRLDGAGIPVMLFGMRANRGLGADYVERFEGIYGDLASAYRAPLYPFFLEGVAGIAALNQSDRIHPNQAGVAVIVAAILPDVVDFLSTL